MIWWIWILLAVALLAAELAAPGGFFLFFFGLAALVVGLLAGSFPNIPYWIHWTLFPILSIVLLYQFRQKLSQRVLTSGGKVVDSMIGEEGIASDAIEIGALGKIELRGTSWNARNKGARNIVKGERCVVQAVEGLTLDVVPK